MSHETNNDANSERTKSKVSFTASFWLIIILVGLFVAALNFIPAMSSKEGHGESAEKHEGTEQEHGVKPTAEPGHEEQNKELRPAATTPPEPEHK